jgi:hypothetical protein
MSTHVRIFVLILPGWSPCIFARDVPSAEWVVMQAAVVKVCSWVPRLSYKTS